MDNHQNTFKNIDKLYDKLTYFDKYGNSIFLLIIFSLILFLGVSYCFVMIYVQPIRDNWIDERCKPYIIPFAGYINKPQDTSAFDYTQQNFQYCMQDIIKDVTGTATQPLTFVVNILNSLANIIKESINAVRNMFNKVRTQIQAVTQEVMGRLGNMMVPLQQIIIAMKDMMGKMQGVMTASLFTLLGGYYTLQSLMGAIAQFIITILIALAATITVLWLVPFTWGTAASMTAIFVAIAIPMSIILDFMLQYLHVTPDLQIPTIQCFDEDTLILMKDGSEKRIVDIQVGDQLFGEDGVVTAKMKVDASRSKMYYLDTILVSDSHLVKYGDSWVRVSEHPFSIPVDEYTKKYLYCLNTTTKVIHVGDFCFSDWDEVIDTDVFAKDEIHRYIQSGFKPDTLISLHNGEKREIQQIEIGTILEKGEKVIGFVEIILDGISIHEQSLVHLGVDGKIEEGRHSIFIDKNNNKRNVWDLERKITFHSSSKDKCLFHLITDTGTFYVNQLNFLDYNASIDIVLDNQ